MAPLVSAQEVSRQFGIVTLFDKLSLAINEGERVAILGRNGSGKSTLLKLLSRIEEPDYGVISWRTGLHLAYVPQVDQFSPESTAYSTLSAVIDDSDPTKEKRIAQALGKHGFDQRDYLVEKMSGGERKRLALMRALITQPELLILDEPTNHLDIAGMAWLEEQINTGSFACIFVSHDRLFIQNIAQRVIELDKRFPGGYLSSLGTYADFLENRASFLEQREQYRDSLANKVRREVAWLRRGPKAQTCKQKARVDKANSMVDELSSITLNERKAGLEFSGSNRKTKELIKAENISKCFGERCIFQNLSLILSPGSRIGIVGLNGTGKSTLLKSLTKEIQVDKGRVILANKLQIAQLDQLRNKVDKTQSLKHLLCGSSDSVVFNNQEIHVAGWARRFLFQAEQLALPLHKLSGGELARALIAKIMLEQADVLVLDEPTNDLDIQTLEALESAISEFPGALLLVSHDRYLLDAVCQNVVGLYGVGLSSIFADYRQWELAHKEALTAKRSNQSAKPSSEIQEKTAATKLSYLEARELSQIEGKIQELEAKSAELQIALSAPELAADSKKLEVLCEQVTELQNELDRTYARWDELEKLQAEIQANSKKISTS